MDPIDSKVVPIARISMMDLHAKAWTGVAAAIRADIFGHRKARNSDIAVAACRAWCA